VITGYIECHTEDNILFQVTMPSESMTHAEQIGIPQMFKLTTAISTSNMMLLDAQGTIKKYDSPLDVLADFCSLRLQLYKKSKLMRVTALHEEILSLKGRIKHVREVRSTHVVFQNQLNELYKLAVHKTEQLIALRLSTPQELWLSDLNQFVAELGTFTSSSSSFSASSSTSTSTVTASASSLASSSESNTPALSEGGVRHRSKATVGNVAGVLAKGGNPELTFTQRELANFCVFRDPVTKVRCFKMGYPSVDGNGKKCTKHKS